MYSVGKITTIKKYECGNFYLSLVYEYDSDDPDIRRKPFAIVFYHNDYGCEDYYRSDEYFEKLSDVLTAYDKLFNFVLGQYQKEGKK